MANYNAIDVSRWQGDIDWKKVKASGIKYAMIRSSARTTYTDPTCADNVAGCEQNGISYGFYHYLYAKTVAEAKREAEHMLSVIKNYKPTMPIALDIEDASIQSLPKTTLTQMAQAFLSVIEGAGYYAILYTNPDWITNRLNYADLTRYDLWLACWTSEEKRDKLFDGSFGMWQCGLGKVSGVSGDVDVNVVYKDYPTIIKKYGLNGTKTVVKPVKYKVVANKAGVTSTQLTAIQGQLSAMGFAFEVSEE